LKHDLRDSTLPYSPQHSYHLCSSGPWKLPDPYYPKFLEYAQKKVAEYHP